MNETRARPSPFGPPRSTLRWSLRGTPKSDEEQIASSRPARRGRNLTRDRRDKVTVVDGEAMNE